MPRRCVAANCSNEPSESVSLFKFPKDAKLCREWVLQVQRTRAAWSGPTDNSVVCSDHFSSDCFDEIVKLKESLGFKQQHKRVLLPSAIPTIFNRKREGAPSESAPKRISAATQKLESKRVAAEALKKAEMVQSPAKIFPPGNYLGNWTPDCEQDSSTVSCRCDVRPVQTRSVAVSIKPRGKSKRTQTATSPMKMFASVYTQTTPESPESSEVDTESESEVEEPPESKVEEPPESDFDPSSERVSDSDSSDDDEPSILDSQSEESDKAFHKEKKFIIFFSALLRLLSWCSCPACGHKDMKISHKERGTMLIMTLYCNACGKTTTWHSQPYLGKIPAGNILLSSAILFAGATVTKVLRVLSHMGVAAISSRTFFRHQSSLLLKVIRQSWVHNQTWLLAALQGSDKRLICGGDGRADSPGHCAKFGTYTLIELQEKVILDIQLVQSNECGGSYHMEKEGLVRSLAALHNNHLEVDVLITDRHRSIAKFIREEHPMIQHQYDVWHVAKGIKTKLRAVGRKSGCQDINPWISSIINHLYWCATSTPEGQGDVIEAKWTSVVEHVQNKHDSFEGVFQRCAHGELEGREARKKWIVPMSKAALEVEKVISSPSLCRDTKSLSGHHQTSMLEAFHSLVIHFAPKMFVFNYETMLCRTMLAALHFNENASRRHKATVQGKLRYSLHYPKYKQGGYVVKKVLEDPTYEYIDDLMMRVATMACGQNGGDTLQPLMIPPTLSADLFHPEKDQAVQAHVSRFKSH